MDVADSSEASGGLMLLTESAQRPDWTASIVSGLLPIQNSEAHLGKLTLSFNLSATNALPVTVRVESFNANKERTGGLQTQIHPAAAHFYQRFALDLSTMKAHGTGVFRPKDAYVQLTFEVSAALGWPTGYGHKLQLDNVHYARPAYYVSPDGKASNNGRTEATAFATPQQALDVARAGDIIVVKNGTYGAPDTAPPATGSKSPPAVAHFVRPGTPAGWIVLKNYPGHQPTLSSAGQVAVNITRPRVGSPEEGQALSYIEVRGLRVRGNGDTARQQFPELVGKWNPQTNAKGIVVNGRVNTGSKPRVPGEIVHHIRVADNLVEYAAGDGIYMEYADWMFVENNRVENNLWTTIDYAPAGLTVMGYANFDQLDNTYKFLVSGNRVSGNRLEIMNEPYGKNPKTSFFNGNGMLFDANAETPTVGFYLGRTLVQNNLVFNNGAAGIQMWGSHRMDVVNNTVYKNGTVLPWGEIGMERCTDVRLVNNIVVGRPDHTVDVWNADRPDKGTHSIVRTNNLFYGGLRPPLQGVNNITANPQFVNPTSDPKTADFRLKPTSPARKAGRWETFTPATDLTGKPRPAFAAPDLGAQQH